MTSKAARRLLAKFSWVKKKNFQKAVCLSQLMEVISVYLCNVIVDLESLTAGSKTIRQLLCNWAMFQAIVVYGDGKHDFPLILVTHE